MRTEIYRLSALALALVWAPALRAQVPADAPPAPVAEVAPAADPAPAMAPQVLEPGAVPAGSAAVEPEGSRIAFNGLTVPAGKVVDGDVVAPFGDVRVEGEVMGDVTVGHGNLILARGATIHGDAVVNGGGRLFNEGGRVFGEMRVNSDADAAEGRAVAAARGRGHRSPAADVIRVRPTWWGTMTEGIEG